ncbi:hypothetical protein ACRQ1B_12015 [Rhizobium panacihumi]|uniref:hypothetical protein n=1 Tax=Rhizobium panacihumi TaxID=2008450 RepID=UPI003D7BA041
MRNLLYSFWAIFWRIAAVLITNYVITSLVFHLTYLLFPQTETVIKIRASLNHLPTAMLFLLLAMRQNSSEMCEPGSASFHWRNTYLILAAVAAFIISTNSLAAFLLPTDLWIVAIRFLSLCVFLILCIALAIRLSRFRRQSDRAVPAVA